MSSLITGGRIVITAASLNAKSVKDLGKVAERFGVPGWRSLKKEQLVKAIVRATQKSAHAARSGRSPTAKRSPAAKKSSATNKKHLLRTSAHKTASPKSPSPKTASPKTASKKTSHSAAQLNGRRPPSAKARAKSARVQQRIQNVQAEKDRQKNLAGSEPNGHSVIIHSINGKSAGKNGDITHELAKSSLKKDRVVLLVRDAYWLQAVWELTRQSVERAQVALAQQWHSARPVLRLIELESNSTTSSVEQVGRVIVIHGGVNTWFIDVQESPKTYRVDVGYMASNGKFFALARSNSVTTPRPGSRDGLENNWSDIASDCEKIYALSGGFSDESPTGELQEVFEERLGRPMTGPAGSLYGVGADKVFNRRKEFEFDVDAEMIIFGRTKANARVTLAGNPIKLRQDGTFAARLALPDRRQVLPIVASSADGVEQHTVVIAVERNTKVMEPMVREAND
jgi:hypothetical protein